jgi:hypothetical protein
MSYGFIITRHVNSELTNRYWNECVRCIRKLYPFRKIVIIDDNSDYNFIKSDFPYTNVEVIQSEFPKRGELLPYYYFYKCHFFDNAIILHDSAFIEKRINFERFSLPVLPLWHFAENRTENVDNTIRLASVLSNNKYLLSALRSGNNNSVMALNSTKWHGCFGCQAFINWNFLSSIREKYHLFNLLSVVECRTDRCGLERILGTIFCLEFPRLVAVKSLLGSIQNPIMRWGYTYQQHRQHMRKYRRSLVPIVKVWTGR